MSHSDALLLLLFFLLLQVQDKTEDHYISKSVYYSTTIHYTTIYYYSTTTYSTKFFCFPFKHLSHLIYVTEIAFQLLCQEEKEF